MIKKRGMSAVVTTLIIILLVVVAMGIVWVVVKNIIDKGSDQITLTGLTLDLDITRVVFDDIWTNVTVKRNPGDGDLVGINFIFSDGDNSVVVRRDTTLKELGVKTFSFIREDDLLGVTGNITSISIAPIFESVSGKEVISEVRDTSTSSTPGDLGIGGGEGAGETPECTPEQTCVSMNYECGSFEDDYCLQEINCGDCEGTDVCGEDDHVCYDEGCVPLTPAEACAPVECGEVSDGCGTEYSCGDCTSYGENWACSLGVCVEGCTDTCESLEKECGMWTICDVEVNCEAEVGCEDGFECVGETCTVITYVNGGVIGWYGPPGSGKYFSSDDLPKEDGLYYSYQATFPNLANPECYLILRYNYDSGTYVNPIVELDLYLTGNISEMDTGTNYEIWDGIGDCCESLSNKPTIFCP